MKTVKTAIIILATLFAAAAFGQSVKLDVTVSNPYLLADQRQSVFLKIGLTGFELDTGVQRPPANVAIVLDKSGSMEGDKIARAREAALVAIDSLNENDIVSIVVYSDTVSVLVPATKVRNKSYLKSRIESIFADGSTALFAGVSKGAEEVSKFFDSSRVNRVILLSDGLANVGPDSPMALGNLGEALRRKGISVTTIGLGLGYNEDLMVELARRSDGNHAFVENYNDLVRIFRQEFDGILSVVAQDVKIEISCRDGVLPLRILGRDAEIIDGKVYTDISQLYSNQEKYLLIELDVPPHVEGMDIPLAEVKVNYGNMKSSRTDFLSAAAGVKFTRSQETVVNSLDKKTMTDAVIQLANEANFNAIQLMDEGKVTEAQAVLQQASGYLAEQAEELDSPELQIFAEKAQMNSEALADDEDWNSNRKQLKADAYGTATQNAYGE